MLSPAQAAYCFWFPKADKHTTLVCCACFSTILVCTSVYLTGSSHYLAMEMRSTRKNCGDSKWLFLESKAKPVRYEESCCRSTKTVCVASHKVTDTFDLPCVVALLVGKPRPLSRNNQVRWGLIPRSFSLYCCSFRSLVIRSRLQPSWHFRAFLCVSVLFLGENFCVILTDFLCIPSLLVWTSGYNEQQRKTKLIAFIISKMFQDLIFGISPDYGWDMISMKDWPFDDWRSSKSYIKFVLWLT